MSSSRNTRFDKGKYHQWTRVIRSRYPEQNKLGAMLKGSVYDPYRGKVTIPLTSNRVYVKGPCVDRSPSRPDS